MLELVVRQSHAYCGSWRVRIEKCKELGSQHPLPGHAPSGLTFFLWATS